MSEFGLNKLTPKKVLPKWIRYLLSYIAFFPLLLAAAGILCLVTYGVDEGTRLAGRHDNLYLGIVLIAVVVVSQTFSFLQEAKAEDIAASFEQLMALECIVIRNGEVFLKFFSFFFFCFHYSMFVYFHAQKKLVDSSLLVPGDIIHFAQGNKVPADTVIIFAQELKVKKKTKNKNYFFNLFVYLFILLVGSIDIDWRIRASIKRNQNY